MTIMSYEGENKFNAQTGIFIFAKRNNEAWKLLFLNIYFH